MKTYGLYESAAVKIQTLKTAIEVCFLLSLLVTLTDPLNDTSRRPSSSASTTLSLLDVSCPPTWLLYLRPPTTDSFSFSSLGPGAEGQQGGVQTMGEDPEDLPEGLQPER